MPIVAGITGQILDDVYVVEVASPPTIAGVRTGIVGLVGTFPQGVPSGIYAISDYPTAVRLLGKSNADVGGPMALQNLLRQKCGNIQVVPVFGEGAQAASVSLYDSSSTPNLVGTLSAAQAHPQSGVMAPLLGSGPNAWSVTVTQPSTPNGTFNLSINGPVTENYRGLTAANWAATINAKSNLVVVSQPSTPLGTIPAPGSFLFTGGSCGTLAATADFDAALIGSVDGTGQATGLALLATLAKGTFTAVFAAEYSSALVNAALANFAATNNSIALICAPLGSTVNSTTAAKGVISQDNVVCADGWSTYYDADQGIPRASAPTALVAGMVSQLQPQQSWGNKTIYGSQGLVIQRSDDDMATLQQNGILCLANTIPRGGFGTRSGVASDGSDVYVRRMRYFLEYSIMSQMGWAVDALQSTSANDPLRAQVAQAISTFLSGLANPLDATQKVIDSYSVTCNLTNNPPDQIAAGLLVASVTVRLLAAAKIIEISANIDPSAVTTSSSVSQ